MHNFCALYENIFQVWNSFYRAFARVDVPPVVSLRGVARTVSSRDGQAQLVSTQAFADATAANAGNVIILRYEDIMKDPDLASRTVAAAANCTPNGAVHRGPDFKTSERTTSPKKLQTSIEERWRRTLPPDVLKRACAGAGLDAALMAKFHYTCDGAAG